MRTFNRFILAATISLFACISHAEELSKASVQTLLKQIDQAITSRNINAIESTISPNANISGTMAANGATQRFRMTKSEYISSLKQSWSQTTEYSYVRKNEQIQIAADKATVSATVVEKMRINGNKVSSNAIETATIELINGKLQITKITANGSMN